MSPDQMVFGLVMLGSLLVVAKYSVGLLASLGKLPPTSYGVVDWLAEGTRPSGHRSIPGAAICGGALLLCNVAAVGVLQPFAPSMYEPYRPEAVVFFLVELLWFGWLYRWLRQSPW